MGQEEAEKFKEQGYAVVRWTGRQWLGILRMTFGKGRLCSWLTNTGHLGMWCYGTFEEAVAALWAWDDAKNPEPGGWMRHPPSGRRRPNGDPRKEIVFR